MSRRNSPYIGRTVAVVGMIGALFAVSVCLYVLFSARSTVQSVAGEAHLSVMVRDDSGINPKKTALDIESIEGVRSARYIDSLDAQREFSSYLDVNITSILGEGAIPSSYVVTVDAASAGKKAIEGIKKQLASQPWVESVSYDSQVVDRMSIISDSVDRFATYFTGAIIALIVVLLYVIARLSVGIAAGTMPGAPERYIRRMLMRRAVVDGAIAGVSSAALLVGGVYGARSFYPILDLPVDSLALIASSVFVGGFLVHLLFTYISTLQISSK